MDGAEQQTQSNAAATATRPMVGFPLGTALVLIVIFCLSGIFSCCYHWERLRSLSRHRYPRNHDVEDQGHPDPASVPSPTSFKFRSIYQNLNQDKEQSLPVIMAGDRFPKFMAWPCPCQHPLPNVEKITVAAVAVAVVLCPSIPVHSTSTQHVN